MLFCPYFICNQKHQCGFVCNNVIVSWKTLLEKIGKLLDEKEKSVCSIITCRSYIIQSGSRSKVIARTFTGLSFFFLSRPHPQQSLQKSISMRDCVHTFVCKCICVRMCQQILLEFRVSYNLFLFFIVCYCQIRKDTNYFESQRNQIFQLGLIQMLNFSICKIR